jgi:methyl-accepting chemotaxis protein
MKRIQAVAALVSLIAITAGVLVVLYDLHRDLTAAAAALPRIERDVHGSVENLNAALIEISLTTDELRRAATEQRTYWAKTSQQTGKTVSALRLLIDRTDHSLNDETLPAIGLSVLNLNTRAGETLDEITQASHELEQRLADPAIAGTAAALQASAENATVATEHLAATSEHMDHATKDIEDKVHQMTRPPSWAKRVGMTILGVAADVGQIFAGFVK